MNPNIRAQKIQSLIRNAGLLNLVEKVRYGLSVLKYNTKNKEFLSNNPGFKIPPKALAFDAYSAPDWNFYKKSGEETAVFLADIAKKYLPDTPSAKVLEWGCGPGRVIRHIPLSYPSKSDVYGADYNHQTINWCIKNITQVNFVPNLLQPPLPFGSSFFDFVYSISVFTHLSEAVSQLWIEELLRVTRPGGVLVITTNGDSRQYAMLPEELKSYQVNGVVVRGKVEEGKKMFMACHSPQYLRVKLFKSFEVLEHMCAAFPHTGQDYWILRKPL